MRKRLIADRIKVGIFTIVALVIVTAFIFYIGSNQQVFGSKIKAVSFFKNVGGLKTGNAVRFSGVVVGAVDEIEIISDSAVKVVLALDTEAAKFIKENSKATISTEGLLGSRYIRISSGSPESETIKDGERLLSEEPLDVDEFLTILNETGVNAENVTANLEEITKKINKGEGIVGALLSDNRMQHQVKQMINSFANTGVKANTFTSKIIHMADTLQVASKNAVAASANFKQFTSNLIDMVDTLQVASENAVSASENFETFTSKLNNDSTTLSKFISDTAFGEQVNQTLVKIENAAEEVGLTSNQIRDNRLLRLFGRKKNKNK